MRATHTQREREREREREEARRRSSSRGKKLCTGAVGTAAAITASSTIEMKLRGRSASSAPAYLWASFCPGSSRKQFAGQAFKQTREFLVLFGRPPR